MKVFFIALLLILIFSFLLHHYKVKNLKKKQRRGLINIVGIKEVVVLIQTHRGLSSALLNGDKNKSEQLITIKKNVDIEIEKLFEQEFIAHCSRWGSFIDHWGRLKRNDIARDIDNNFKQHTQLISNLLYLLEDVAEFSHLSASTLPKFKNIGFVWRELVVAAETIGQSRAIGMGVATSKECSSVDKIRLSFLLQKIQKTMDETIPHLTVLDSAKQQHQELRNTATSKIKYFISIIENDLIESHDISIDKDEYFLLATDSIAAIDKIFSHQLKQIEKII